MSTRKSSIRAIGSGFALCCALGCGGNSSSSDGKPSADAGSGGEAQGGHGDGAHGGLGGQGGQAHADETSENHGGAPETGGKGGTTAGSGGVMSQDRTRGGSGDAAAGGGGQTRAGNGGTAGGPLIATPAEREVLYVGGNGTNVSVFQLDTKTGVLTPQSKVAAGMQPSYLAVAPNHRFLYAIDEGGSESQVSAFAIDPKDGHLTALNTGKTGGQGAPHLAVHPSGNWLAVTHYGSGQISILPIAADGSVMDATVVDKGPSPGCTNAHQAVFDSTGKYLFVPCLGSNFVIQFKFDAGKLSSNDPPTTAMTMSPRHLAFDPAEHYAYLVSEYESTLTWFKYDAAKGTLSDAKLTNSYQSKSGSSAHVLVHPSGKWLYASNRTENSLGLFSIDPSTGTPKAVAFETDMIAGPRDFSLDPSGQFLVLSNQDGAQNVLVYRIAQSDGKLTRVHVQAVGENPTCTLALPLP